LKTLKKNDTLPWTDRTGAKRQGKVVSFVPAQTDATNKLTKKHLALPQSRRKIEAIAAFDRYLVEEVRGDKINIFSLRANQV
jgi:hypothetical protein